MLQLPATILKWLQNLLKLIIPAAPADKPAGQPGEAIEVVQKLPRKPDPPAPATPPYTGLESFFIDRRDWLRRHPYLAGFCVLVSSVGFMERHTKKH